MLERKTFPRYFLTKEEKKRVETAIQNAESRTSGEIRVALDRSAKGDVYGAARKAFEKMGMTKTKLRNGVLIFLAIKDHAFAILGDQGIHEKVGEEFWKQEASLLHDFFVKDEFGAGLEAAIQKIGDQLARYFPGQSGGINELPDKIEEN